MKIIMLSSNHYDFLRRKGLETNTRGSKNYNGKQIQMQIQIQIQTQIQIQIQIRTQLSRAAKTITEECIHSKIFLLFKTQCKTIL